MFKNDVATINLSSIQSFHDNKKIDLNSPLDLKILKQKKIINKKYSKLKILGAGEIKTKLTITADFTSKQAKAKIEKVGGKLNISAQMKAKLVKVGVKTNIPTK